MPTRFTIAATALLLAGGAAGLAQQSEQLVPSTLVSSDTFGKAVAVDRGLAVVGAPRRIHDGRSITGAAYVLVQTANGWSQEAELTAAFSTTDDLFGNSVAVHGSLIAIGAQWHEGTRGASMATRTLTYPFGVVYVFRRERKCSPLPPYSCTYFWRQEQRLAGEAVGDEFGNALAIKRRQARGRRSPPRCRQQQHRYRVRLSAQRRR